MGFLSDRLVIGHRGAAGLAPENTLHAFAAGAELGVDAVELDVHYVHGRLLVIHDDSLDRTTSGTGPLSSLGLAELRALDAGGGHPVPYLEEVFDALPKKLGINVELKGAGTAQPVFNFLRAGGSGRREVLVSSFDLAELRRFAALAGGTIKVAPLCNRWHKQLPDIATELGAWSVNLSARAATRQRIHQLRERGFKVLVYTVNESSAAERLFAWGATGIFTDFPDRMVRAAATPAG